MKSIKQHFIFCFSLLFCSSALIGQEFVNPRIYVTNEDKAKFLKTLASENLSETWHF